MYTLDDLASPADRGTNYNWDPDRHTAANVLRSLRAARLEIHEAAATARAMLRVKDNISQAAADAQSALDQLETVITANLNQQLSPRKDRRS